MRSISSGAGASGLLPNLAAPVAVLPLDLFGMEVDFAQIMEEARYEYVLSYISTNKVTTDLAVSPNIEVKVDRSGLIVNHRKSYLQYPERQPQICEIALCPLNSRVVPTKQPFRK